jgi:hypothetical protein
MGSEQQRKIDTQVFVVGEYMRMRDMAKIGNNLDWTGNFVSPSGPCLPDADEAYEHPRHTLVGYVIENGKLSNLLTAYLTKAVTHLTDFMARNTFRVLSRVLPDNHIDDQYDLASYQIGFDLYRGVSVEQAMKNNGTAQQKPGTWDVKLWPNEETPTGGQITRPSVLGEEN